MQQNDKSRQRLGVTNWTATPEAFPGGLAALSAQTGWKYVAHNRYWGNDVVYAKQNGGDSRRRDCHSDDTPF